MSEHTPEPWYAEQDCIYGSKHHDFIANANGNRRSSANARRIVACVNACHGIDTENLERKTTSIALEYTLHSVHKPEISQATALELLEACEKRIEMEKWLHSDHCRRIRGLECTCGADQIADAAAKARAELGQEEREDV